MSAIDDDWSAILAADSSFFGREFTFHPMAHVAGRYVDDPERPTVGIVAAIDESASLNDPIGERNASGMSKGVASAHATALALVDFPTAALSYAPRAKDRLIRLSNGVVYEVSAVLADDFGRTVLRVVRLGTPP